MSLVHRVRRINIKDIQKLKGRRPIVALTAYSATMAARIDSHVDLILVGDSLGMVLYGFDNTLPVTLDMMTLHGKVVVKASSQSCVIIDLPFGSYQESREQAFHSASQLMKDTGANGIKLEGGAEMQETISFLVDRNIPVLAHIGLMPQSVKKTGGYRVRGKTEKEAKQLIKDAKLVQKAGAFAAVLEGIWEPVARKISSILKIPTIGIGASPSCDGQILVTEDLLGMYSNFTPKFVKRYSELGSDIESAVSLFSMEVKSRTFPGPEHCFGFSDLPSQINKLKKTKI